MQLIEDMEIINDIPFFNKNQSNMKTPTELKLEQQIYCISQKIKEGKAKNVFLAKRKISSLKDQIRQIQAWSAHTNYLAR